MDDKDQRAYINNNQCVLGAETGPQSIVVRQIIGERERQKVLDIEVVVPDPKPSIEQIVDVFVKDVEVCNVEVITDKVIVRGEFEIKAIYVAALPDQPVHAVEIRHFRFTQDIEIPGARRGMDADASVIVEFVDYDTDEDDCGCKKHHHHHHRDERHHHYDCDDDCNDYSCDNNDDHDDCDHDDDHHHHHHYFRDFMVSVVLKITAKVMADREVMLGGGGYTLPSTPKG